MKRTFFRGFGIAFIIWGIFLAINSYATITGFVVFDDVDGKIGSFLAAAFIIIGIVLMTAGRHESKGIETKVSVYDQSHGKVGEGDKQYSEKRDRFYGMTDPHLLLGTTGTVSLGEFRKEIDKLRRESGGEDLVEMVRGEYSPSLMEIAQGPDSERAQVAKQFLDVLGVEMEEKDYHLTPEEKREIVSKFKDWKGDRITNQQKEIFRKYGIDLSYGGNNHIRMKYMNKTISASLTPSAVQAGTHVAKDIISMINEQRDIKHKKKS